MRITTCIGRDNAPLESQDDAASILDYSDGVSNTRMSSTGITLW